MSTLSWGAAAIAQAPTPSAVATVARAIQGRRGSNRCSPWACRYLDGRDDEKVALAMVHAVWLGRGHPPIVHGSCPAPFLRASISAVRALASHSSIAQRGGRAQISTPRPGALPSRSSPARRISNEARVAFLVPPGFDYVAVLLGVWRAGGTAVPLAIAHPPAELQFVIRDSGASLLITTAELVSRLPAAEATGPPILHGPRR